MSFVDSLLKHSPKKLSVLLVDKRAGPGGHWNDAYGFVTLHQPARNYGVESSKLEAATAHPELLASRAEVLAYYKTVLEGWQAAGHDVRFVGGASFDFDAGAYTAADATTADTSTAGARAGAPGAAAPCAPAVRAARSEISAGD